MAKLLLPDARIDGDYEKLSTDRQARIDGFLPQLIELLLQRGGDGKFILHGSASRGTIAWVLLPGAPAILVSDFDIIVSGTFEPWQLQGFERDGNRLLEECIGSDAMSPGSRVSLIHLDSCPPDSLELRGLRFSALEGGIPLSSDLLTFERLREERKHRPPRFVQFALPYALFRFVRWISAGSSGAVAGCYELAKGINRSRFGDTDGPGGNHQFYDFFELRDFVAKNLVESCRQMFKNAPEKEFWTSIYRVREVVSDLNPDAKQAAKSSDFLHVVNFFQRRWPHSLLAHKIELAF